jgi:hypothetical protein
MGRVGGMVDDMIPRVPGEINTNMPAALQGGEAWRYVDLPAAKSARVSGSPNVGAQTRLDELAKRYVSETDQCAIYCTSYAEDLMAASGGEGKIVVLSSRNMKWRETYHSSMGGNGALDLPTIAGKERFSYHSVYTDGRFMFDPFVSELPLPQAQYLRMLSQENSAGISWRIYTPTPTVDPTKVNLNKGGF